ncbi:tetratricopeptide repeat-containing sensor histidine kinase [Flavobacterium sp. W20_MBD1_R3]|uniref:tetratricopeptide repeat-containing sensor histidine kinase n=1 Tax=Flavobacterium sp. W20_MBD1_R3 TaxID=3240278 RepID=UPI003F91463D
MQSCTEKTDNISHKKKNAAEIDRLINLGEKHFEKLEYDSSYYYFNEAKLACDVKKDTTKIIYSLVNLATIEQNQGDYSGSEATILEAFPFLINNSNPLHHWGVYTTMAINYMQLFDYDNALYYNNKALNLNTDEDRKAASRNNIASIYMVKEEYKKAITIFLPLSLNKKIFKAPEDYSRIIENLGYCYFKTGNPKGITYINESLRINKQRGYSWGIITSYCRLSEYYMKENPILSQKYSKLAYEKATKVNDINDRLISLSLLIENSPKNQTKKLSLDYIRINDSINKVRQKAKNQFAKIKYDSKKDKDENLELKTQKIENALLLEKQKNRNLILSFVIGITLLLSITLANFLIAKNRRERIKTSYRTEIRISKKLHDELANDVYQTMAFAETQDLSTNMNKEILLTNLDTIYSRTRNISRENSTIEAGAHFEAGLKDMMSGFHTHDVNILTNGMDIINWNSLNTTKKITLYRVLQELLINMKKHSQCSLVVITFKIIKNKLQVDYTDNGVGTVLEKITSQNGLQNVENRIHAIKGTINFDSKSNKGFRVRFIFPI